LATGLGYWTWLVPTAFLNQQQISVANNLQQQCFHAFCVNNTGGNNIMKCPMCGNDYFGRGSVCTSCAKERNKEYMRNYARNEKKKTIRCRIEDYEYIRRYADDTGIKLLDAIHILIHS
jgi:hypothetical protein